MATLDDLLRVGQSNATLQRKTLAAVEKLIGAVKRIKSGTGLGGSGGGNPGKSKGGAGFERLIKGLLGFGRLARGLTALGRGLGPFGIAVAVAAAAFATIPLSMIAITKAVTPFVRALNPSVVQQLERAQNNLSATIGYAFTPIIVYAAQAVREFTGVIYPALRKLRPGIEKVSRAFIGVANSVGQIFSIGIEQLANILKGAGEGISLFAESIASMAELITAAFAALFEGVFGTEFEDLGDAFEALAKGVEYLTKVFIIAYAQLASILGLTDTLAAFQRTLNKSVEDRKNPKPGLTAAPTDVHTGGGGDLVRRLNERAFVATQGGETKKTDNQLLKEIAGALNDITEYGTDNTRKLIAEGISEWWDKVAATPPLSTIANGFDKGKDTLNRVGQTVRGGFDKASELYKEAKFRLTGAE